MAVNDTFFFSAQGTLQGQIYIHTLNFRELVGPVGANPAQHLIDKWQSTCQTPWLGAHGAGYTLTRVTAQKICGTPPLPARVEEGVGAVGTRTSSFLVEPLAPWLAVCINESTGLAGKSRHGRFFMSGGGESDISGETLSPAGSQWLSTIQAYCTALKTQFIDGPPTDWQLVVHSRKLAAQPGTQCQVSSEPVVSLGINARLTTQRSRRA